MEYQTTEGTFVSSQASAQGIGYDAVGEDGITIVAEQNDTMGDDVDITPTAILLIIVLTLLVLCTIFGNILTLTAIFRHRPLQTPQNYLIASLAVADLMVAVLVMPLSLSKEVVVIWIFGDILCDVWLSLDVLCCTASILSLCMISLDRFWAITKPVAYPKYRTKRTMVLMIIVVWILSGVVSTSPLFGWPGDKNRDPKECQLSQDIAFTILSTFMAFFIPMTIMMIVYARIFVEARKRIRKRTGASPYSPDSSRGGRTSQAALSSSCRVVLSDPVTDVPCKNKNGTSPTALSCHGQTRSVPDLQDHLVTSAEKTDSVPTSLSVPGAENGNSHVSHSLKEVNGNDGTPTRQALLSCLNPFPSQLLERERKKRAIAAAREQRAAKTLGIVTGAFLICWLPFFLVALIVPLCGESCLVPKVWQSLLLWLGYFNSMLNPIIYTKFNRDFQKAFKKLLCCDTKHKPQF